VEELVKYAIACECGHSGFLCGERTDKYHNLRERCFLEGFKSSTFTIGSRDWTNSAADREQLLKMLKGVCPSCGALGKTRFV